ncbi:MAG: D-aminoacyl-tRNA deacylase [Pseudomonadota bacterium]
MRLLIQRVTSASVDVAGECIGAIEHGMLVFAGVQKMDDQRIVDKAVQRLLAYRVFSDEQGKMNLNVRDVGGSMLLVSQFTLAANTRSGLRPSFSSAAAPDEAAYWYEAMVEGLNRELEGKVETGRFGADMKVSLVNDGPVTFVLDIE